MNYLKKQGGICALSGMEIIFRDGRIKNRNLTTASIDRIDSNIGYIENNIQWVHKDINWIKWSFDQNYFIELCKLISIKDQEKDHDNSS